MIKKMKLKWRTRKIRVNDVQAKHYRVWLSDRCCIVVDHPDYVSIKQSMEYKRKTAFIFNHTTRHLLPIRISDILLIEEGGAFG